MRILLIHLDLGIGGAERLMVNLALAMKELGHSIKIFTSHHDQKRCFQETTKEGKLGDTIEVYGDWIPRHFLGKLTAFFAINRMIYLSIMAITTDFKPDVIVIDGVSIPIPLLKIANLPVLFYCHYPDKLLCVERMSFLKRLYRLPIDILEEFTTGCADCVVVNSKFTGQQFKSAFTTLGSHYTPKVLYPSIDMPVNSNRNDKNDNNNNDNNKNDSSNYTSYLGDAVHVFVSLNRYERKKNIPLALQSFQLLLDRLKPSNPSPEKIKLVIAGGYDTRVAENVEHHQELVDYAKKTGIASFVIFRQSIDDKERNELLKRSSALLYTPSNEHFGIVPLEAMSLGTPVIAVNSGGPLETIKHEETGFLCNENPNDFMEAMYKIMEDCQTQTMGTNGIRHVQENFTNEVMKTQLQNYLQETIQKKNSSRVQRYLAIILIIPLSLFLLFVGIAFKFLFQMK